MNNGTWSADLEDWDFDPRQMARYDWLNNPYIHEKLNAKQHLSIERNGYNSISVHMRWMEEVPHDLYREFEIGLVDGALTFSVTKINFDERNEASIGDLPLRVQREIVKADEMFRLKSWFRRLDMPFREHCARSTLEYWRRSELAHLRAEDEFEQSNRRVVRLWTELQDARSSKRNPLGDMAEGMVQKRIDYAAAKAVAEQRCHFADVARRDAELVKVLAMDSVMSFKAANPDVTLPIDEFFAKRQQDGGSRMGM
jgi:hypothetical protein